MNEKNRVPSEILCPDCEEKGDEVHMMAIPTNDPTRRIFCCDHNGHNASFVYDSKDKKLWRLLQKEVKKFTVKGFFPFEILRRPSE